MWDPPRPGTEPESPELAGRFLSSVPPGKSLLCVLMLTDVLDSEDIGRMLEMAELWITYSFVNFLEYSCHPSAWLSVNFSTREKLFPSYISHCYFAFFYCLQLKGILCAKSVWRMEIRKMALDSYIFLERLIFLICVWAYLSPVSTSACSPCYCSYSLDGLQVVNKMSAATLVLSPPRLPESPSEIPIHLRYHWVLSWCFGSFACFFLKT